MIGQVTRKVSGLRSYRGERVMQNESGIIKVQVNKLPLFSLLMSGYLGHTSRCIEIIETSTASKPYTALQFKILSSIKTIKEMRGMSVSNRFINK